MDNQNKIKMRDTIDINSNDNALFVTAQCNNRCVMCCQPPAKANDIDALYVKNIKLIDSAPKSLPVIGITGGEPTLLGDRLFELISHIKEVLPDTEIHILSNGRAFANIHYAMKLARCGVENILFGIPLHADNAVDHDTITRVKGSFDETLLGLYNLERMSADIELRYVLTKMNYARLPQMSDFIYRNLPFVRYISLMGLEYTGYTIKNHDRVWVDPIQYQDELRKAVKYLAGWNMDVSIFNLSHCVLPEDLWSYARKSISDWKNNFEPFCDECTMKAQCCGLFATSRKQSPSLHPIK